METNITDIKEKKRCRMSSLTMLLGALILLLLVICIYLVARIGDYSREYEKESVLKESSISEKEKLIIKLKSLEIEYDELSDEYVSLDSLFSSEKKKVADLIKEVQRFKGSAEEYKNKVIELENRLLEYLANIEELKNTNKALTSQNVQLVQGLDSVLNENFELVSINQELVSIVEKGSKMRAYDVVAEGIRMRSGNKEIGTENAKRVQKIRICFLLGENAIVKPGLKTVYIRISEPGGTIITHSPDDLFFFENHNIAYSIKQEIIYNNKAMDLCLYWEKDRDIKKGLYEVFLFLDSQEIGRTSFVLE